MAVAIVQTVPFTKTASQLNPQITVNGVVANNTLYVLAAQLSSTDPGWPTDTLSDIFTPIGDGQINQAGHSPLSEIQAFCLRAKGGHTPITVGTIAASCGVAMELSNVAVPVAQTGPRGTYFLPPVPDDICSRNCPSGTSISCDINPTGANGSLVLAMAVVVGNNALTFQGTGFTALGNGSVNGISFDAQSFSTAGPSSLSLLWTSAIPADALVVAVSFPSA